MKTLIYINEKRTLKSKDFLFVGESENVTVPEKFLICGIVNDGKLIDPFNPSISVDFLKPIELYLMCGSNVDFHIDSHQFRFENVPVNLSDVNLHYIEPSLPTMGVIVEIDAALTMVYNFIDAVDSRVYGGATGYASQGLLFHYKRPGETGFTVDVFYNYGNEQDLTDYYNPDSQLQQFPSGTEFYFKDERSEFGDTNHFFMP